MTCAPYGRTVTAVIVGKLFMATALCEAFGSFDSSRG